MYSKKVLKRFVSDYKLPIPILAEPYFSYYLDLYDSLFQTKEKFELLQQAIRRCGSENAFLDTYYGIRDNIITTMEATGAYREYNTMNMDKFNVQKTYPTRDVFKKTNIGKCFMSIDLKKANFQALKYLNHDIVLGHETYESLIGQFTDLEYMMKSKYLRQVIFGNMNPKKQVKIERFMTQQILDYLLRIYGPETQIFMVSNDEIVMEESLGSRLSENIKEVLGFDVDVEIYELKGIGNTQYYKKEFMNKPGYELMCVPPYFYAQVYKYVNGLPLNDLDMNFFYENKICRFMEPINFEMEEDIDDANDDQATA